MFQRVFYRKGFCKLLSSHLWRSYITLLVEFSSFSVFVWTALDKCVWRMKIILWDASSFRHSNNIQVTAWNCKGLIAKFFDGKKLKMKVTIPVSVIKNKKQCFQLFLDWTRTLVLRFYFFTCLLIGRAILLDPYVLNKLVQAFWILIPSNFPFLLIFANISL